MTILFDFCLERKIFLCLAIFILALLADVATTEFWRCKVAAVAKKPESNCHQAGPGAVGNTSCACVVQKCGDTPITPSNTYVEDAKAHHP